MLRGKIADEFLPRQRGGKLAVTFMSFGFKHGPPREEDVALDVRFLPNPHYVPELRELTGNDERVVEYVARDGRLQELYERLHPLLDFLLPQYVAEGKAHLVIAIGCTGGRHRSVAIARHLAERYRDHEDLDVAVAHRDIDKRSRES
jgi:RNase adapter protein RapZ